MKKQTSLLTLFTFFSLMLSGSFAMAEDIYLEGDVTGGVYDSSGAIIAQNNCTIASGVTVTTLSTYETILKPGTHIQQGATFTASLKDLDGLSNYCETEYFQSIYDYGPYDDPDGDGINNYDECAQGTHPFYDENNPDRDGDGMHDLWELQYWVGDLSHDPGYDDDGDGVINSVEYELDSNPTIDDLPGPGVHYEYDELGRIKKVFRIPGQ